MTGSQLQTFVASEGLALQADTWGRPGGTPVLFAHGGGQTRHAWGDAARRLAERGHYAVTIDLRGHGDSAWSVEGRYGIEHFAEDLIAVAGALGKPHVVGASLGGMSALIAEGTLRPGSFASLTLVDIAPRIERDGVARIVGFMAARRDEGFATLEEAADAIAHYLPHRPRPRDLSGLAKNLRLGADGRYRWHWDPRFLDLDTGPRVARNSALMEEAARRLSCPTHLIRGRMSELVSEAAVDAFLADVPHAHYSDISGAGHMVAGDRNDAFTEAVIAFLERLHT